MSKAFFFHKLELVSLLTVVLYMQITLHLMSSAIWTKEASQSDKICVI